MISTFDISGLPAKPVEEIPKNPTSGLCYIDKENGIFGVYVCGLQLRYKVISEDFRSTTKKDRLELILEEE